MNDLLFAVPWWLPTLLAVIGIALFINGNASQVLKVRNLGIGLALLAIVWALVSYLVDTDKEKVEKGTRQVVQVVVDGNWTQFQASLTPSVVVILNERVKVPGAEAVTAFAKLSVQNVKLKSARIQNFVIEQTGPLITVNCDIFSQQDSIVPVETSSWQFVWEKPDKGWKLREIRLIALKGVPVDDVPGTFPVPK